MSDLPASALHCRLILKSEVPRCSLCGLIEPCRHHAKPNDANCSESKSASELDQVSETIMLEHGKKQERGSCQEYERSGTCRRLEWYGSCPYWHPEQEVKPPIIVERCDVCTLPLPCFLHNLEEEPSRASSKVRKSPAVSATPSIASTVTTKESSLLFGWKVQSQDAQGESPQSSLRDASRMLNGSTDWLNR